MKIFLDAGHNHSGADTGAQGNGLKEQDITYQIALKVSEFLRKQGVDIKLSRPTIASSVGTSKSESINGRVNMANLWKADYFVSIHCNAATSASANGTETLIYNAKSAAYNLAMMVNSNLVGLGLTSRGVKVRTDLGVLKHTNMPSILIEVAFISNGSDAVFLRDRQDEIAQAIANGIFEFTGIETKPTAEDMANDLSKLGIISSPTFWALKADVDEDIYWLLAKYHNYVTENGGSVKDRKLSSDEAISILHKQGIISDPKNWNEKAYIGKDDVYWLLINMADYIN